MKIMTKYLEKIIRFFKRDPTYKVDKNYSSRELFFILFYRFLQVLRGFFIRFKLKTCQGLIFSGHNVRIEHGYLITSGPSLILGDNVSINALSKQGIKFGRNVTIGHAAQIICTGIVANKGEGLQLGDYSSIGAQSFIGAQGNITIGDNVIMGPGVKIFSENHNYSKEDVLIRKQGETRQSVKIGNNCWIGAGTTILAGVMIGDGCVIAAGAVVTKSIPPDSLVAGVPAKIIKSRTGN